MTYTPDLADSFETYDTFEEAADENRARGGAIGWPRDFLSAVSSDLDEEYAEEIDL